MIPSPSHMQADARRVRAKFKTLGVKLGDRKSWCAREGVPYLEGDPDIVAYDRVRRRCIVTQM
jgi:hypothetical protein